MNAPPNTVITRAEAVAAISGAIADRTTFVVVGVGPADYCAFGERLCGLTFTAYLEGPGGVLSFDECWVPCLTAKLGIPASLTVLVPKSVTADELSAALGDDVTADGSRDLLILQGGPVTVWPQLFIDALELIDPRAAAGIRLHDIATTN